jgi:hypothetical protein
VQHQQRLLLLFPAATLCRRNFGTWQGFSKVVVASRTYGGSSLSGTQPDLAKADSCDLWRTPRDRASVALSPQRALARRAFCTRHCDFCIWPCPPWTSMKGDTVRLPVYSMNYGLMCYRDRPASPCGRDSVLHVHCPRAACTFWSDFAATTPPNNVL